MSIAALIGSAAASLDPAADERHVRLELGVEHLERPVPGGSSRSVPLEGERRSLDVDVDGRLARAVGRRPRPVVHLDDREVVPDERLRDVGQALRTAGAARCAPARRPAPPPTSTLKRSPSSVVAAHLASWKAGSVNRA